MSEASLQDQLEAAKAEEKEVTNGRGSQQDNSKRGSSVLGAGEGAPRWQADGKRQQPKSRQQGSSGEQPQQPQQECTIALPRGGHGSHARDQGPQGAGDPAAAQGGSPLLGLDGLLCMMVLAKLSPEDLLAVAQVCRQLNAAASNSALWCRLYLFRWPDGPQDEDAERVQGVSWRRLYLERDGQTVEEARAAGGGSEEFERYYLQMATAKRSEALKAANAETLFQFPDSSNVSVARAKTVEAYRREHNLTNATLHEAHRCSKADSCRWDKLDEDAWICARSGFVHVCDANCTFRELKPSAEGYVCQVSSRCFPAEMLTEREEHAADEVRGQSRRRRRGVGDEEDWAAEDGAPGLLGRLLEDGYNWG